MLMQKNGGIMPYVFRFGKYWREVMFLTYFVSLPKFSNQILMLHFATLPLFSFQLHWLAAGSGCFVSCVYCLYKILVLFFLSFFAILLVFLFCYSFIHFHRLVNLLSHWLVPHWRQSFLHFTQVLFDEYAFFP